jgi:hypothetical protein
MFTKLLTTIFLLTACSGSHPAVQQTQTPTPTELAAAQQPDEDEGFIEAKVRQHQRRVPPRIRKFDANHDGVLERTEVPARLQAWFAEVDANHDGIVTAHEIRAYNRAHGHGTNAPAPHDQHIALEI